MPITGVRLGYRHFSLLGCNSRRIWSNNRYSNTFARSANCRFSTSPHYYSQQQNDYYKILGVSKKATSKEIRDAFLLAAKENHPDKLGTVDIIDDGVKGLKFIEVKEAYEVLSDVDRRREYDTMHQGYQRKDNVRSRYKSHMRSWDREAGVSQHVETNRVPFTAPSEHNASVYPGQDDRHGRASGFLMLASGILGTLVVIALGSYYAG